MSDRPQSRAAHSEAVSDGRLLLLMTSPVHRRRALPKLIFSTLAINRAFLTRSMLALECLVWYIVNVERPSARHVCFLVRFDGGGTLWRRTPCPKRENLDHPLRPRTFEHHRPVDDSSLCNSLADHTAPVIHQQGCERHNILSFDTQHLWT